MEERLGAPYIPDPDTWADIEAEYTGRAVVSDVADPMFVPSHPHFERLTPSERLIDLIRMKEIRQKQLFVKFLTRYTGKIIEADEQASRTPLEMSSVSTATYCLGAIIEAMIEEIERFKTRRLRAFDSPNRNI